MTVSFSILRVLFVCSVLFTVLPKAYSSVLGPGDIAFTSYNSSGNNRFSFVLLTDVSDSTALYFTTNAWDASASGWYNNNEGTILWYHNGYLPCGTEIQINPTLGTVNLGVYSMPGAGFNPLTSGDAILAYVGTAVGVQSAFVSGINVSNAGWVVSPANNGESSLPPGLLNGVSAIELTGGDNNWIYNCSSIIGPSAVLAVELNSASNWNSVNFTEYTAPGCVIGCGDFNRGPSMSGSGNALTFDGTDDYLVLPDSSIFGMDNTHVKTIELWVKSTVSGTTNEYILSTGSSLNSSGFWIGFAGSSSFVRLELNDGVGTSIFTESTTPIRGDNKWHHLAAVFNGANASIVVDGVIEGTALISAEGAIRPSGLVHVGNSYDNAAFSYFSGSIDELRIWDAAVPTGTGRKRMCQKLNLSHPLITSVLGYYNFDQSAVSQLIDLAGGNHAQLTNMDTINAWVVSGAPLGNRSSSDYSGALVSEIHSNGDSMSVSNYNGFLVGIHVYLVQDPPNFTTISGASAQNNAYHFGVFKIGADSTTYDVNYSYGNTALLAGSATEYRVGLASREDNTDPVWESKWFEGTTNTLTNTVFLPGQTGTHYAGIVAANNALDFDGVDDGVATAAGANVSGAFTAQAWVQIDDQATTRTVLSTRNGAATDGWVLSVLPTEQVEFRIATGLGWRIITSTASLTAGSWHHLSAVFNGDSVISLYIDGVEEGTRSDVIGYAYNPANALFVGSVSNANNYFNGLIDEVRIWQRELCSAEVQDLSGCEFDTTQNALMAYYSFNQGVADSINTGLDSLIDQSGNGFNGTLSNFALSGTVSNWRNGSTGVSGLCAVSGYAQILVISEGDTIFNGDTLTAVADSTNFGTINLGQPFSVTYEIHNTGFDTLFLTNVTYTNVQSGVFNAAYPPFILPGNSGLLTVIITPNAVDTIQALVNIESNDCDASPYQFKIEGVVNGPAGALHFDGTNDFVSIPSSVANNLTTSWTLEGWFKPDALSATWEALIAKDEVPIPAALYVNGTKFEIWLGASATASLISNYDLVAGEWVHVAATFYRGDMRLYVNGALDNQVAYVGTTPTSATPYYLGRGESGFYYQGEMDEVRIWDRARNLNEIQSTLHCELDGDECNLVHYFNFNNAAVFPNSSNAGLTIAGDSALTANGTLTNFGLTGNVSNWTSQSDSVGDNCSLLGDNVLPVVLAFDTVTVNLAGMFTLITPAAVDSASCDYYSGIDTMWVVPDSIICGMNGDTGYLFVQDSAGLIDSSAFILEVIDAAAPVLLTNDVTIWLDATGNASILPDTLDSASFDNCQIAQFISSDSTFTCADVGVNNLTLTAIDINGNRVEKVVLNEKGEFDFKKLSTDGVYAIRAEALRDENGLFLFSEEGKKELSKALLKGALFKKLPNGTVELYKDELLDNPLAAKFAFDYNRLDVVGTRVFLLDKNGNEVGSSVVNAEGLFAFSELDPDQQYALKFEESVDAQLPFTLYGFTEDGERIPLASDISKGKRFNGNPAFSPPPKENEEVFKYSDADGNAPPAGTKVYVKDENDVVLDSGYVDADGNIKFTRLPPDANFKLQLANTDDLSMGLDRFFVTDAEGKKVAMDETGQTIGKIVTAELAENTETFTFGEDAAPPPGTMVYVTDENDNVIDSAEVDEFGEIRFTRLPPDGNYKLKLDKALDGSMGLDRFFITDAEGKKVGFDASGATVKTIVGKELAESTETFTFAEDAAPPAGTMVYVTDENDIIIDSAEVDEFGEIRFTRLPPDGNYKLKLDKAIDGSMGLDRFFIVDAEGDKIGFNADGETVKTIIGEALAETTETFTFEGESGPPPGTVVYVTDENDNVIDSATVDEFGEIRFTRLPPDGNYKLKLDKAIDNSMGLDRFFITDGTGEKVGFNADGTTEMTLVSKEKALRTDYYKFNFSRLPQEGSMVYLLDASNFVIDSARVDQNGGFRFKRLDPKKEYSLKIVNPDGSEFSADYFELIDKSGKLFKLNPAMPIEDFFASMSEDDVRLNYELFQFDFNNLPKSGSKVYLYNERGTKMDSTITFGIGSFNFKKLDDVATYYIKVKDNSFSQRDAILYALLSDSKRKLNYELLGFKYSALDNLDQVEDTKLDIADFLEIPADQKAPKLEGRVAYLIDAENKNALDSVVIDQDGSIEFTVDITRDAFIKFNDSIDTSIASVYAISSVRRTKLESTENGYTYLPSMKGSNIMLTEEQPVVAIIPETLPKPELQPEQVAVYPPLPEAYLALNSKERYAGYDQFQFEESNVPAAGTKIIISNEAGDRLQTATIYENGVFIADKMSEPGNYYISSNDPKYDNSIGRLYTLTSDGRVEMKKEKDGFVFTVKQAIVEEKIDLEQSNFVLATQSELSEQQDVYLFDMDEHRYVDTMRMTADGAFAINDLDRTKTYRVDFDSTINTQESELYAILGDDKKEVEKENGNFIIKPIDLLDGERKVMRVSFLNADSSLIEVAKTEEVGVDEEPYPLTPPVNEEEESIAVEESVVNNTVFEKPPVKAEAKVKKAAVSADYSDFRLKDGGFAEVVETRKGWNLHFDFNEFLLSQNQMDYVYEVLIPLLRKNPDMTLVLEGHTDSIGTEDVNYRMSVLRISNVLYHIEMNGIEDTRITVRPKGEKEPLAPNSTEEGRAINRRVEIIKSTEE